MAPLAGTPSSPIRVRVFVASPDDVTDERATAMKLLEELPADPLLEGRLALQVVAWDKHGVGVPMLAGMTPQDAILHNLPKPAECDVVVLILWSRVGTPLDPASEAAGGAVGVTGTISEYRNAVQASQRAGGPQVLVYHRTEEPRWAPSDPEAEQKRQQWQAVQAFIAEFRNPDGSFKSGYNEYASTSEFAKKLDGHLRYVLRDLLGLSYLGRGRRRRPSAESPFPGLHAFTRAEEAFFFGRAAETDDLVRRCADRINRFVAVVGASGVGKSSVVAAGLMPRLLAGAVEGSTDWLFLRCSPGEARDPFLSLAFAVQHAIGEGGTFRARELADALAQNPTEIGARIAPILVLARKPPSSEIFIFIDQFEELFTVCDAARREPFIELLRCAVQTRQVRVVVTLRADFYAQCTELGALAELLRSGSFPLAPPGTAAMVEMITQPAEKADLVFERGLPERIMTDMGSDRAALPLLAFALRQLWERRDPSGELTAAAYDSFEGIRGVIGTTAEQVFGSLKEDPERSLAAVFGELVSLLSLDGQLTVTRRRAALQSVKTTAGATQLVERLLEHRLLVTDRHSDGTAVISVAHEALLSNWSRLSDWIALRQQELWQIQMARSAATEWERHHRSDEFLWPEKRLTDVHAIVAELKPQLNDLELRFLGLCGADDLLAELDDLRTGHRRRAYIGDRLSATDARPGVGLRPDGLPDILWCAVPRGEAVALPHQSSSGSAVTAAATVEAFEISKYPVTWKQFKAFVDHPLGYRNTAWWIGLGTGAADPGEQRFRFDNCPAENVSWYDAVAFCRWLSEHLHAHIHLPSEHQWLRAAIGDHTGPDGYRYPWGSEWSARHANTQESGLGRPVAVGQYPQAASPFGVHDLAGNVWEWCSDEYDDPQRRIGKDGPRVVKGGAWSFSAEGAWVLTRERDLPDFREYHDHGFRVCRSVSHHRS